MEIRRLGECQQTNSENLEKWGRFEKKLDEYRLFKRKNGKKL